MRPRIHIGIIKRSITALNSRNFVLCLIAGWYHTSLFKHPKAIDALLTRASTSAFSSTSSVRMAPKYLNCFTSMFFKKLLLEVCFGSFFCFGNIVIRFVLSMFIFKPKIFKLFSCVHKTVQFFIVRTDYNHVVCV